MDEDGQVSVPGNGQGKVVVLKTELLVPSADSPRTIGTDNGIEELAASIQEVGVLQPLLVRPEGSGNGTECYEIIAGHRRHRAASMVGLSQVPCIICSVDSAQGFLLSITENLQRDNLHPLDEAWAYDRMIEKGIVHNRAEIARRLGVSRARITQRMQLLHLDEKTKLQLIQYAATLSEYHARLLLTVDNLDARHRLAEIAGQRALSGRELRTMIEEIEENDSLESWGRKNSMHISPRKYQASLSGFRLFIDYTRVSRQQVTGILCRVMAHLNGDTPCS